MRSYLEVYAREISPRLKAIDTRLKSGEEISLDEAAALLGISEDEILRFSGAAGGRGLTSEEFLSLMELGSGAVCGLYRRELERRSPITYTAADIAYIYDIGIGLVQAAFDRLNAGSVTEYMLPEVFAGIWLP